MTFSFPFLLWLLNPLNENIEDRHSNKKKELLVPLKVGLK